MTLILPPPPVERPVCLSRVEFMRRVGPQRWTELKVAAATDPVLSYAMDLFALAAWIEPTHPETQAFAGHCVVEGWLTQQEADDVLVDAYLPGESGP